MECITYEKYLLKISHVWYPNRIEKCDGDIVFYHQFESDVFHMLDETMKKNASIFYTLYSDLRLDEKKIWSLVAKNTKYEIRRAERDGVSVALRNEISGELLNEFKDTYNQMYRDKGLSYTFNELLVKKYIENNKFRMSLANYKGNSYVFHGYLLSDDKVRLLYSCSLFRENQEMKTMIGMMNRYLHWRDLLYFKKNNFNIYDWGGINSFDNPNQISKFKLKFGGEKKICYNILLGNTLLGRFVNRFCSKC